MLSYYSLYQFWWNFILQKKNMWTLFVWYWRLDSRVNFFMKTLIIKWNLSYTDEKRIIHDHIQRAGWHCKSRKWETRQSSLKAQDPGEMLYYGSNKMGPGRLAAPPWPPTSTLKFYTGFSPILIQIHWEHLSAFKILHLHLKLVI